MRPITPNIRIEVVSEFHLANDVVLTVTPKSIVLTQHGPRGGEGPRIELSATQWAAIDEAVRHVTRAIRMANDVIEGEIKKISMGKGEDGEDGEGATG